MFADNLAFLATKSGRRSYLLCRPCLRHQPARLDPLDHQRSQGSCGNTTDDEPDRGQGECRKAESGDERNRDRQGRQELGGVDGADGGARIATLSREDRGDDRTHPPPPAASRKQPTTARGPV